MKELNQAIPALFASILLAVVGAAYASGDHEAEEKRQGMGKMMEKHGEAMDDHGGAPAHQEGLHAHTSWPPAPPPYAAMRLSKWDDQASIARGEPLYQKNCAVCHGPGGKGDGPAAAGLSHPPANLNNHFHSDNGKGDAYLFWRLSEGGGVEPFKSLGSAMPAFNAVLNEQQRWDILRYVHHEFHKGFLPDKKMHAVGEEDSLGDEKEDGHKD